RLGDVPLPQTDGPASEGSGQSHFPIASGDCEPKRVERSALVDVGELRSGAQRSVYRFISERFARIRRAIDQVQALPEFDLRIRDVGPTEREVGKADPVCHARLPGRPASP
ncbi:MAG: hypothetical protein ACK559_27715, partial [bacterium]